MDIYDYKNNFIVAVPKSNAAFPGEYIKDTVFISTITKGYKYYPPYTNLYAVDGNRGNIISLFDVFADNNPNMRNQKFSDGLYDNLKKDFKLAKDKYDDVLQLYINPDTDASKRNIKKIYDSVVDARHRVDSRILEFDDKITLQPDEVCDTEDVSTCKWSRTSSKRPSTVSSKSKISSPVSEISYDTDSDTDTDSDKKEDDKRERDSGDFIVHITSYELHITETQPDDTNLYRLYDEIKVDEKIISTGMVINGESKFKKIESDDKFVKRYLKEFMDSEHVTSRKYLKPDIFHFLYDTKQGIILGEINQKGGIKLKIKPKNVHLSTFDDNIKAMKSISEEIYTTIDRVTKMKHKDNIQPYIVNFKAVYEDGYIPVETIAKMYNGKIDRGIFVRFNYKLKDGVVIKNILYSKKNDNMNYTVSDILPGNIEEILKSFQYFLTRSKSSIITGEKKEIKKKEIKTLDGSGIPTDSRECPKDRRPTILENADGRIESIKYQTNKEEITLGCTGNDYIYPGYTKKNRIPCCFKKSQKEKNATIKTNECLQKDETKLKILGKRTLMKDNIIMDTLQRGRFANRILSDIFQESDYYSLSAGIDSSLEKCLKFIYCDDIVKDSVSSIDKEIYTKYEISLEPFEDWVKSESKSIESIMKSTSFYKKVNPLVIQQEEKGTKIICSMTNFFLHDKYLIFTGRGDDYRILVNTPGNKGIIYEIESKDPHIQKLITLYNSYCSTTECKENVPKLQEIMKDSSITIENQVVNVSKKVLYIETKEFGILPIAASSMDKTLNSKIIKDMDLLNDPDQYDKLKEVSKKYKYLTPVKMVVSVTGDGSIKGIEIKCGMVVPVIVSQPSIKLPESNLNFYIDLDDAIKSEIISDEELRLFKEDVEDSYVKIGGSVISNYLTENSDQRIKVEKNIDKQEYDEIIKFVIGMTIKEEMEITKETLPVEETIPFKISSDVYDNAVSRISWDIINNNVEFLNSKPTSIKTKFISNSNEVEINNK